MQEYLKQMRSGFVLGGDIHHYFSEPFGLGLKYNYNAYKYSTMDFDDRNKLNYIALSALNRVIARSGNEFLFGANMGYQSYLDKLQSSGTALKISGGTVGFGLEIGYAIRLAQSAKLFFNLALMSATISKINVESDGRKETIKLDKNEMEGLGRLELTVGMHFGH
ncbi:outer membrane beta-barrel protein [Dyadobacter sandarakinus]|uniref:Outer membrane beta-barrel protein n=1 Tax=Dyadobacter sandarakinus TaxID=2747268 RepID=A0ABX7I3K6_9BACT|nr:outer membrane beta-barrel protein [Dyadobacter sandarakinus]QRR00647.1 outer membrane beta-barrel protein [Dyadobacter sandarakinus]